MPLRRALLFCAAAAAGQPPPLPAAALRGQLQAAVDAAARLHNASFSVGVYSAATGSVGAVAGADDRRAGTPLSLRSRFPMGSVTKSWTSAAVMQMWDAGRIDIDAPISRYVDPLLRRLNGTTLLELWGGDPRVANFTARRLMAMRSGLQDYDDAFWLDWTLRHPDGDWTPLDMLHRLDKRLVCDPGACGHYASPGYEILGMALCHLTNCSRWEDFDQLAVLPAGIRASYTGVAFPGRGKCSADPLIVHQYRMGQSTTAAGLRLHFADDLDDCSCLGGWTCGNIAATTVDVARWFWALFHGEIVSPSALHEMVNGNPLNSGWSPGLRYGLGTMQWHVPQDPKHANLTLTVGHGGDGWGSLASMNGYNAVFNFSISLATGAAAGMNCSEPYRTAFPVRVGDLYANHYYLDTACRVYDVVLQAMTGGAAPRLNCSAKGPPSHTPRTCSGNLSAACRAERGDQTRCLRCAAQNEARLRAAGCTLVEERAFCAEAACLRALAAACGPEQAGGGCEACVAAHAADLAECSESQKLDFCPAWVSCERGLSKLCGESRRDPARCRNCTAAHRAGLAAANCTGGQILRYCPKHSEAPPTPNFTCSWDF